MAAFVFDCDGVLVDSEPLARRAWAALTAGYGYETTDADDAACMGRTEFDTWEYLTAKVDLPPFEESLAAVDEVRFRLYDAELRAFPDAEATVRMLAMQGLPLAVASSSRIAEVHHKLDQVGLSRYFQAFAGGDEVDQGKPAPAVYLLAAERLGVGPATCLAVEDAEVGAIAAVAAGMRVVLILRDGSVHGVYSTVSSLDADLLMLVAP